MPSVEHEEMAELLELGLGLQSASISQQRAAMETSATLFPAPDDMTVESIDAHGVPCDRVRAPGLGGDRVLLYLHGGAYVTGSRNSHRGLAARIGQATRATVLLPEYRLAPEHPFPAAVTDAVSCWRWLLDTGCTPSTMTVAGDSAGGGLALAVLLALRQAELPLPACAVALSPWTDLEAMGPTAQPGAVSDPMLSREGLLQSANLYAAGSLRDPLASPLHGDLVGLPPILLQVGTREVLLSDSTRFAERARAAGVTVELDVQDGLVHVWQMFPELPESRSALARIGRFVDQWLP